MANMGGIAQALQSVAQGNWGEYTGGEQRALGQYGTNYYDPYTKSGNAANSMYANALGLNGRQGNAAATNAFQVGPGYQFALGQGIQGLDRSASAKGFMGSGNAAMAVNDYSRGMANQEYGNWLQQLQGLGAQGLTAAAGQTGRQGALAGINMWKSSGVANSNLDAAKAFADAQAREDAAQMAASASKQNALTGGIFGLLGKFI